MPIHVVSKDKTGKWSSKFYGLKELKECNLYHREIGYISVADVYYFDEKVQICNYIAVVTEEFSKEFDLKNSRQKVPNDYRTTSYIEAKNNRTFRMLADQLKELLEEIADGFSWGQEIYLLDKIDSMLRECTPLKNDEDNFYYLKE
ncbi:MAG: hypothetical protein IJ215_04855 [Clostridia bacterium]|nr:hypothetical protein [Clostridia bacterium]